MRKRNQIVFELVRSEEEYLQTLSTLVTSFFRPLKMAASSKRPPLSHEEVNSIFLNRSVIEQLPSFLEIIVAFHCNVPFPFFPCQVPYLPFNLLYCIDVCFFLIFASCFDLTLQDDARLDLIHVVLPLFLTISVLNFVDNLLSIVSLSETLMFLHQIFFNGLQTRMESWPTLVLGKNLFLFSIVWKYYLAHVLCHTESQIKSRFNGIVR